MKDQIKNLRIRIDSIAQLTKELKPIILYEFSINREEQNSKEIEKAVDSLYLAKSWLGKMLEELGIENPYGSGYKTKEDIVPTQDVKYFASFDILFKDKNHIEKVDWLRTEIEALVKEVIDIFTYLNPPVVNPMFPDVKHRVESFSREYNIARTNSYNHLCEAKFWLGFELGRIRDNK